MKTKKPIKSARVDTTQKRVTFQLSAKPNSKVFVAGSFNNWDTTLHALKDVRGKGKYTLAMMLPKGKHEYKFIVNGTWTHDAECPHAITNEHGSVNSILHVE